MKPIRKLIVITGLVLATFPAHADEREVTDEQKAAVANAGDQAVEEKRPANLPDVTKGESIPIPKKGGLQVWVLGPTGIMAQMNSGSVNFSGDQLLVKGALKGSPAEGKVLPGDVITSIGGVKLKAGGHLGITIANAIMEAERAANGGVIKFGIWRDLNYPLRNQQKDVTGVDVDKLFREVDNDNSLYDWKPETERKEEMKQEGFDKFPIKPSTHEIELKLRVFPDYSDTAPFNCPKTMAILEDAWKVLEDKFKPDPKKPGSGRGDTLAAIALVASGKPEHRKLVHEWVRTKNSPWGPPTEPTGAMFEPKGGGGYKSWHMGSTGLNCALYYEATGDEYVLPALRKMAIETAMGQSGGGSWGHTFAFPSFNGGRLHQMNPGYGALNAAGNRCFFLIALAQKLGIKDPEIDAAVKRAQRFFGSYVDQGAIPYGDHPAAGTDDSNGKNTGIAFALKVLGDDYGARYFAMMSAHCAFTRRGGHGHDYTGEWSSWAATLCGPEIRTLNERNLRWRRTLCRMFDGSFIYQSPTGTYGAKDDPTSVEVLHQSLIFKQTLITGKNVDESSNLNPREMKQMLASARGQFNDPYLLQLAGKPWNERSTDEIFDLLDMFMPKTRENIAAELGKRFQAGESAIAPRLVKLLTHENARYRHGALCALDACGNDVMLSNLSTIVPMLNDPKDFVRIAAVRLVSKATNDKDAQLALLKAAVSERTAVAPNSVRNAIQTKVFGTKTGLSQTPFKAGFDASLVEQALSELILEDTGGGNLVGGLAKVWDKDTVTRLAGPLVYIAEEEQVVDQMFGARNASAQAMLAQHGYIEALQTNAYRIRKKSELPRHLRESSTYKKPLVNPIVLQKEPGAFTDLVDEIKTILIDNPLDEITIKDDTTNWLPVTTPLAKVLRTIEEAKPAAGLPSIADDARKMFDAEVAAASDSGAKTKLCRDALAKPARLDTFRKIAAMDHLAEMLGPDALQDLLPYLGHEYWRLRDHSRTVAANLVKGMAGGDISRHFEYAPNAQAKAGFLAMLAASGAKSAVDLTKQSLKHESPEVRSAAVKAYVALAGDTSVDEAISFLQSAKSKEECIAGEDALLSRIGQAAVASKIRDKVIGVLPEASTPVIDSLYFILARIGDTKSIDVLRKASLSKDPKEFDRVTHALSYSPSREADQVLLEIAKSDPKRAQILGPHAVRRMAIGPKGYGDVTDTQKIEFADAMLKFTLEHRIVKMLSTIHDARALRSLMYCLEKGVAFAAVSLITNAEGMGKLNDADSKIAAETLRNVIEYIEVTRLRGGMKAHMNKDDNYVQWKALQARAGKALLKFHKPDDAPIPGIDSLDLER